MDAEFLKSTKEKDFKTLALAVYPMYDLLNRRPGVNDNIKTASKPIDKSIGAPFQNGGAV